MFTIEVPSCTLLVCSASSVSSVNASRPHASATQMEWIPAASAIFARSINALKSNLPCQFTPIVSLRAMIFPPLFEVANSLVPSFQIGEAVHHREILRVERQEEKRMVERRVSHREICAVEKVLARELLVDQPAAGS